MEWKNSIVHNQPSSMLQDELFNLCRYQRLSAALSLLQGCNQSNIHSGHTCTRYILTEELWKSLQTFKAYVDIGQWAAPILSNDTLFCRQEELADLCNLYHSCLEPIEVSVDVYIMAQMITNPLQLAIAEVENLQRTTVEA